MDSYEKECERLFKLHLKYLSNDLRAVQNKINKLIRKRSKLVNDLNKLGFNVEYKRNYNSVDMVERIYAEI